MDIASRVLSSNFLRRPSRRTALVLVGATVIMAAGGLGVALGSNLLSKDGGSILPGISTQLSPTIGSFETDQASLKISYTTSWGEQATIWNVPTTKGINCTFMQLDPASDNNPAFDPHGPATCPNGPGTPVKNHLGFAADWHQTPAGWSILIEGRATPGSDITQVSVESANGPVPLVTSGGYFIGEISGAPASGSLPSSGGVYSVVGTDSNGNEITQAPLTNIPAPKASG